MKKPVVLLVVSAIAWMSLACGFDSLLPQVPYPTFTPYPTATFYPTAEPLPQTSLLSGVWVNVDSGVFLSAVAEVLEADGWGVDRDLLPGALVVLMPQDAGGIGYRLVYTYIDPNLGYLVISVQYSLLDGLDPALALQRVAEVNFSSVEGGNPVYAVVGQEALNIETIYPFGASLDVGQLEGYLTWLAGSIEAMTANLSDILR